MTEPAARRAPSTDLVPVGETRPVRAGSAAVVEQTSQALVGVLVVAGDAVAALLRSLSPEPAAPVDDRDDPVLVARRVSLGLALGAQRRALDLTEASVRAVAPTVRWLLDNPLVQPVRRAVTDRIDAAYERGLAEEQAARDLAARAAEQSVSMAVPVVLSRVDIEPIIEQVLGEVDLRPIVERVLADLDLPQLVDGVISELDMPSLVTGVMGQLDLPTIVEDVMAELDLDPIVQRVLADLDLPSLVQQVVSEVQMSAVVLEATGGVTGEVVNEVRSRAAMADRLVEKIVAKVVRRRLDDEPPLGLAPADAPAEAVPIEMMPTDPAPTDRDGEVER